eukprot:403345623
MEANQQPQFISPDDATPDQKFNAMNDAYQLERNEFDPIFYLIGFGIFIILFWIINKDGKKNATKREEADPRKILFTKEQLRKYDGNGPDGKIYIACNELIFDVTESPFYQKGGDYEKFAGRDMTMAAAYQSTDEKYLDMDFHPDMRLNVNQEQNIHGYYFTFCQKYRIVGTLKYDKKD